MSAEGSDERLINQYERALQTGEAHFRSVVEQSAGGVIIVDRAGIVRFANPAAEKLFGRAACDIQGTLFGFPLVAGETTQIDVICPSGEAVVAEMRVAAAEWEGQPAHLVSLSDVTAHRRATELEKSRHFFRASFDSLPAHIAILDQAGNIIAVNRAWRQFADQNGLLTPNYGVGTNYLEAIQPSRNTSGEDDAAAIYRGIRDVMYGARDAFRYEYPCISTGGVVWYMVRVTPFASDDHGGVVVAHEDITERKNAENDQRRLIAELDAFAHTVAHDLKNPLSAVVGFASTLTYITQSNPEVVHLAEAIEHACRKMVANVDALLLLASVRASESLRIEPLEMGLVVAEAEARLIHLIDEHQADIVYPEGSPFDWPVALGYAPWVEQIWANYISNAIKYGGEPPSVELGAARELDGEHIRFWVRDNGPGIAPEKHTQAFAPFNRLSARGTEGHGLGLSIVQRIVSKLGGSVGLESQVGKGSTFSFTLPAAPTEQQP
jgi:signal transduction histidine kinase